MKDIYIYGAGGMAKSIFSTAQILNYNILGFIDDTKNQNNLKLFDKPILKQVPKNENINLIVGVGDCNIRKNIIDKLSLIKNINFISIIHPSAIISKYSKIGIGVYIGINSIIDINSNINNFSIINNCSIINHDVNIGKYCHIAPNVAIAGNVNIGDLSWIGIGSCIKEKINIGNNVLIGAGSVVVKNIQNNAIVYGNPAKIRKYKNE